MIDPKSARDAQPHCRLCASNKVPKRSTHRHSIIVAVRKLNVTFNQIGWQLNQTTYGPHTRLTRYYIRPFQYNSCYGALTTFYDFLLIYQYFNAKSTAMFDTTCLGCTTIRVKGVLVCCIPCFRYSAINCMASFLIME